MIESGKILVTYIQNSRMKLKMECGYLVPASGYSLLWRVPAPRVQNMGLGVGFSTILEQVTGSGCNRARPTCLLPVTQH
jgi:hypothetical protein